MRVLLSIAIVLILAAPAGAIEMFLCFDPNDNGVFDADEAICATGGIKVIDEIPFPEPDPTPTPFPPFPIPPTPEPPTPEPPEPPAPNPTPEPDPGPAEWVIDPNIYMLTNFQIQYRSYGSGHVRYFRFYETSNKEEGNNYPLIVSQMDMTQGELNDIDMILRYAGEKCEDGKPTISDYEKAKSGAISPGTNGFYFWFKTNAFETIELRNNPEGCYYVMVLNPSHGTERRISIKYEDHDSQS